MPAQTEFKNTDVANKFDTYPPHIREKLLFLRELIFTTASLIPEVGPLEEALRWGEPSYLTSKTKSGSTIRIDWKKSMPNHYGLYVNCKSTLISSFKDRYHDLFHFEGNRSIVFSADEALPQAELEDCVAMSLTYNLTKKGKD